MRCPFCHTKLSKKAEMCPNCGQKIEVKTYNVKSIGTISRDLIKKMGLSVMTIAIFFGGMMLYPSFWRLARYESVLPVGEKTYTFEKAKKDYIGILVEEDVDRMILYRQDLKNLLKNQGYQNIQITEGVNVDGIIHNSTSLTINAKHDEFDVKITYIIKRTGELAKTYAVAGSGMLDDRGFELTRDDVKDIFEYLGFEDGYQVLADGYSQMHLTDNNQYTYMNNDRYNVLMNNEIYNLTYSYSYMISQ